MAQNVAHDVAMNKHPIKQQESPPKARTMNMRMTYAQYQKLKWLGGASWVRWKINQELEVDEIVKANAAITKKVKK